METEAKTIRKLLAVETKNLWPPVMDALTVTEGYENALGAALGDDLDAPADQNAPMRWAGAAVDPSDPQLPEGVTALSALVNVPAELARRLAQIGVVERADGGRLTASLKPGNAWCPAREICWRWDGFAAAAHAPTGAARRLAERGRLQTIEGEVATARAEADAKRKLVQVAEASLAVANTAETEARAFARKAQEAVDGAREIYAAAERESSRHTARMSALSEARQRIATSRDEAIAGHRENESALAALPDAVELEDRLAQVGKVIAGDREALAAVRVESQAITREAELAAQRLQTIAAEQAAWDERNQSAAAQIATLGQRAEEAKRERAELESAPEKFAGQRHTLIGEIETASATRRAAADRLAEAETEQSAADKAARVALEAVGEARAEAARAEERCDGARRRVADIEHEIRDLLDVDPAGAAEVAEIKQGEETPPIADVEAKLDRLRRERERLGSVNLLAEQELRELETQHGKLTTSATIWFRRSGKCARASRASTAKPANGCYRRSNR